MNKPASRLILCAALVVAATPFLSGCFPVIAAGVGATALMAGDRRQSDTYISDQANETRASDRVYSKYNDRAHVNFTSYNRVMLLTGEAPDEATRADIGKIAAEIPNVKSVVNQIAIAGNSSFTARSSDTIITSKVKARFVDANKFAAHHVKVVTEAGVVHLLGIVSKKEADDAVEIARTTSGVAKVVRVFEIRPDAEIKAIDAVPPPPPGQAAPGSSSPGG